MRSCLVTGATGFVGRHLCAKCKDYQVIGLGRTPSQGPWNDFIVHDISEKKHPDFSSIPRFDTVYHLASKAHALSEHPGEDDSYARIILNGTKQVLRAAEQSGVESFIYLSSVKAMGEGDNLAEAAISEESGSQPDTPYGIAKLQAEELVLSSSIPHVVVLRPVMVYGPGHKGNLVKMAEAIRQHRFPPIKENGNRRSMVHVDDVVDACLRAVASPAANREVFILADPRVRSTRDLYNELRSEMGLPATTFSMPTLLLQIAAKFGDLAAQIVKRRMPLDSDTLNKLLGSAWYDGSKATQVLGLSYENGDRPLLEV